MHRTTENPSAYCIDGTIFAKETQELTGKLLFDIKFKLVKRKRSEEENLEDEQGLKSHKDCEKEASKARVENKRSSVLCNIKYLPKLTVCRKG